MATGHAASVDRIAGHLGDEADSLLAHVCKGVPKGTLTLPGPDHLDRVFTVSDRKPQVLVNPLSLVAPGIFREMFQMTPSQSVTPPRRGPRSSSELKSRSSSAPAAPAVVVRNFLRL